VYRHFGEVAAGTSPLYERVAVALSESGEALRAIEAAPARKRHPTVILAALHDLALARRAPALAAAYAAADGDAAAAAAIDTLLQMTDSVVAIAVRRPTRAYEPGRCAVLYPAIAEAARRVSADAVGLIDVGCSAGLNLSVDRVGIAYSNGQSLGDPSSAVQMTASVVGDRPIPAGAMPGRPEALAIVRDLEAGSPKKEFVSPTYLGGIWGELGEKDKAYDLFTQAAKLDSKDPRARAEAEKLRPDLVALHDRKAREASARQDLDTAIMEWTRVLDLDPNNATALRERQRAIDLQKITKDLPDKPK